MTDKVKISLWIPKELKEKIRKLAKLQRRSMSLLNEMIIESYLKKQKWGRGE